MKAGIPGGFGRAAAVAGCAILLLASGCGGGARRTVERPFLAMGTMGSVMLPADDAGRLVEAGALVEAVMRRLESDLSVFNPDSSVSRLNAAAGGEPVEVSTEAAAVLARALEYGEASGGAFDITVGPLMVVWGFRGKRAPESVPASEVIEDARARVGYRHVRVSGGEARIDRPGVAIDLGGIAKGFAVDRAWETLREHGFGAFMVNLGGNMRCSGEPRAGSPWRVGVRDPFVEGSVLGVLVLRDGQAVATSGSYERFVTIGDRRYSHVMDPRTGYPVEGVAGVTIRASTAMDADALSTAVFVDGARGLEAIGGYLAGGVDAVVVPDSQPASVVVSPGLSADFVPSPGVAVAALGALPAAGE